MAKHRGHEFMCLLEIASPKAQDAMTTISVFYLPVFTMELAWGDRYNITDAKLAVVRVMFHEHTDCSKQDSRS
jgi:hypothetical protein